MEDYKSLEDRITELEERLLFIEAVQRVLLKPRKKPFKERLRRFFGRC